MWYQQLTRRELIDLLLGQSLAFNAISVPELAEAVRSGVSRDAIIAIWEAEPTPANRAPTLFVVQDEANRRDVFALANSASQASLPFSSFYRVLTIAEITEFSAQQNEVDSRLINSFIALSYTEAIIHGARQIKPAEVSVAMCRRTLALTWAVAVRERTPIRALPRLTDAWLDSYELMSGHERSASVPTTISALFPVLSTAAALYFNRPPKDQIGNLCSELLKGNKEAQEIAWRDLAGKWGSRTTLAALGDSTREVRADFLQTLLEAYRQGDVGGSSEESAAIVAFVANQIAPGSLEHLQLLGDRGGSSIMAWYTLFASLMKPEVGLTFNSGVGRRLFRDIEQRPGRGAGPCCDISYEELHVVLRAGLDGLSRKLGHSGEISIELVPQVEGIFRFPVKQSRAQTELFESTKSADTELPHQTRERISQAIQVLQAVLSSNSETTVSGLKYPKPKSKKNSI